MAGPLTAGHVLLKLVADYAGFNEDLDRLGRTAGEKFQGISTAGSLAMTAMGGAIVGALGLAVREATSFHETMGLVSTLGVKDLGAIEESVKNVATTFGVDLVDAGNAAYKALSSGATEIQIPAILEASAKAAIAGASDLNTAVGVGMGLNNAYGKSLDDLTSTFDYLFAAVNKGETDFGEMSASIGRLAPAASAAGISMQDMLASVAAVTNANIETSEAVSGLKAALANIIQPSEIATKTAADLGIEFNVSALAAKGLGGFMKDLMDKTGGNIETMAALFGSVEGLNAALALGGNQAGKYADTMALMADGISDVEVAFNAMLENNPNLTFQQMVQYIKVLAVEIGDALLPALVALAKAAEPVLDWMAETIKKHPSVTAGIVGIAAALGGLLFIFGSIGLALAGIGLGIGAIGPIVSGVAAAFTFLAGAIAVAVGGISFSIVGVAAAITAAVAVIGAGALWVVENWEYVKDFFVAWWDGIKDVYSQIGQAIMDTIGSAIDWVIDKVAEGWEALKGFFGFGGGDVELPAGSVPGAASGGMVRRGGFVEVGEHGKELLFLPRGAEVVSSPATEAILRGGAGGSVNMGDIVIHSPMVDSEERLQRLAGEISRRQGWMLKEALSLRGV